MPSQPHTTDEAPRAQDLITELLQLQVEIDGASSRETALLAELRQLHTVLAKTSLEAMRQRRGEVYDELKKFYTREQIADMVGLTPKAIDWAVAKSREKTGPATNGARA